MKFKLKPLASVILLSTYFATPFSNVANAQNAETYEAGDTIVLEEIVVTARGRTESIQTVPISETVFTAQTISDAGIDQVDGFLRMYLSDHIRSTTKRVWRLLPSKRVSPILIEISWAPGAMPSSSGRSGVCAPTIPAT